MVQHLYDRYQALSSEAHNPAYLCLRQALAESIESNHIPPNHALPSERMLARKLDLSRVTVRKALAGLIDDGLIIHRHGAGNFVADRITSPLSRLTSFTEDLKARGLNPKSVFLGREIATTTPDEAMALNLSPGSKVARLHRLRYGADEPLAIEYSTIDQAILPDPSMVTDSLYAALDTLGHRPIRALQRMRAVNLNAEQARLLKVPSGSAGLALERRSFLTDGRVVEFTRSWYRGDMYDFVAELKN